MRVGLKYGSVIAAALMIGLGFLHPNLTTAAPQKAKAKSAQQTKASKTSKKTASSGKSAQKNTAKKSSSKSTKLAAKSESKSSKKSASSNSLQTAMAKLKTAKTKKVSSDDGLPTARYASVVPTFRETGLPPDVRTYLAKAGIPLSSIGVYVQEISPSKTPVLSVNVDQPMNPASTMKLLTTYAAMEIMGPQYQWTTSVYRDGPVVGDVLQGNLIIKGTGDPKIGIDELRQIAGKLREMGIREITGDLILDRTYFSVDASEARPFDGDPDKPGNVPPDSLMLGHRIFFAKVGPDPVAQRVMVTLEPELNSVEVVSNVTYDTRPGACRKKISKSLTPKPEGGYQLTVNGTMSTSCPDVSFRFASVDMPNYFGGAFESLWQEYDGVIRGRMRNGQLPAKATLLATYYSHPLSSVVVETNKRSNNMFAKQLFLGIGAARYSSQGSQAQSIRAIQEWLQGKGITSPDLILQNGSGLSRIERISPKTLGLVLENAVRSPIFPDFFNSLPLVGVDGTMAKRLRGRDVTGNASIKTGTLRDVKCVAGYVRSLSKREYVVVFFINHPNAGSANGVQALDRLIEWVYFDAPNDDVHSI